MVSAAFADRPLKKLFLFDVDGTLSPARQSASPEMVETLRALKKKAVIGFVGGSDLVKITEQLQTGPENVLDQFDYGFAENGLTAYKLGKKLPSQSFINFVGEERGTFVEFRRGMINVSPMGRNATIQERNEFEALDLKNGYRAAMIQVLKEKFPDYGLTFSIGGKISFDIFPNGWDKTFALGLVEDEQFEEIHFFGDKTYKGGNDYEIFSDSRTIGHSVKSPADTIRILKEEFLQT
ncbi:phosphomannomutase [Gymnopilus junonius]|uniref:Phosphomannomutase n=1 Tax=Gymnopilus junonius TaxID=109634 RepID=A0A9P5NNQ9_GYMJU|nr:phosphomannomutase [Gymnopilus junonius]